MAPGASIGTATMDPKARFSGMPNASAVRALRFVAAVHRYSVILCVSDRDEICVNNSRYTRTLLSDAFVCWRLYNRTVLLIKAWQAR